MAPWHAFFFLCARRQFKLLGRDTELLHGRLVQVVLAGFVVGTLFLQIEPSVNNSTKFLGVSFTSGGGAAPANVLACQAARRAGCARVAWLLTEPLPARTVAMLAFISLPLTSTVFAHKPCVPGASPAAVALPAHAGCRCR